MVDQAFDLIVVGGAGRVAMSRRSGRRRLGMKAAVVEREHLGGNLSELGLHSDQGAVCAARKFTICCTGSTISDSPPRTSAFDAGKKWWHGLGAVAKQLSKRRRVSAAKRTRSRSSTDTGRLAGKGPNSRWRRTAIPSPSSPAEPHRAGGPVHGARSLPGLEPDGEQVWTL